MTIQTVSIQPKEYDLINILDDERDVLEQFDEHSGYICDAISAISDGAIPIYNHDVWKNASDIQDYIEEAIEEGLVSTERGEIDLIKIFQAGYYVYYQRSLYDNMETMVFNYIASKVNEGIGALNEETQLRLDTEEIISVIEDEVEDIDNNDTYDTMEDVAQGIIERIQSGEFAS